MRIRDILRVIALTLFIITFALVLITCGGKGKSKPPSLPEVGNAQPVAEAPVEVSLDEALAELDALETPDDVDPALFQQLKDELAKQLSAKGVSKIVSTPPTGEANRVDDLELDDNHDGTYTLTWSYKNVGDYDQNGTVGISDITPIAMQYGETATYENEWIDGDDNGTIGISDITPLAMNFSIECPGYDVEGADNPSGPWTYMMTVPLDDAQGERRLVFYKTLSALDFEYYRVTPVDSDGAEGVEGVPASLSGTRDKMTLWTGGTQLRGVNIWQGKVITRIYGDTLGTGTVGPPLTQADFDAIAAMGANYVNIAHPGLYDWDPPYALNEGIQANLDSLLSMAEQADMFAVITFRTGPGRSEFTFSREEVGDWFTQDDLVETVWENQAEQDLWADMWRYTADRYKDNPIVVGYDLMNEPNAPEVLFGLYDETELYYPVYADAIHDWNRMYPPMVDAIREVDTDTPILVACTGWSAVVWLPFLQPVADNQIVYTVHQYAPADYTHQTDPAFPITYPGTYDLSTLQSIMTTIDQFKADHSTSVASNEWGPMRFEPGAHLYVADHGDLFDQSGVNNALWEYAPDFVSNNPEITWDGFNFRHGPDPNNHANVATSDLIVALENYWGRNTIRPSNWTGPQSPVADLQATPTSGDAPLTVYFDASGSADDVEIIGGVWDLDGDGNFAEADNGEDTYTDNETAEYTYNDAGEYYPAVRVTDGDGLTDTASVTITVGGPASRLERFQTINHFMYQIQGLSEPGAVDNLEATHYDLLVLEPTNTFVGAEDFDVSGMVAALKASPDSRGGNKLVIAYIDVGEAENYRTYWQPEWIEPTETERGDPDFLVTMDPDGWSGNFPVAYWDQRWIDIMIDNPDSALNQVIDAGFEGIYMDWVEAYDDEKVIAAAQAEVPPIDPPLAMVEFIGHLREVAKARDPEFLVIQQNAPFLIEETALPSDLAAVIDGLAMEDTWFLGEADVPWGDSRGGDTPQNSTGDYSTESLLAVYPLYTTEGLSVWTVDYCLIQANADQVYADSSALGYIPLVTQTSLWTITETPPPWY